MVFFLAALVINAVVCVSLGLEDTLTIFIVCIASTLVLGVLVGA